MSDGRWTSRGEAQKGHEREDVAGERVNVGMLELALRHKKANKGEQCRQKGYA
jgi:hypothetical protein